MNAIEIVYLYVSNRFGDMISFSGQVSHQKTVRLLDFFREQSLQLPAERPLVPYNSGFAMWQEGKFK